MDIRTSASPATATHVMLAQASLDEMTHQIDKKQAEVDHLRHITELIADTAGCERFIALAMAVCNKLAAQWQASRVCIGFLRGRTVRLLAMSQTEKILRKMQLVQSIEAAMEECLDQDCEILAPASPEASFINRCATKLADTDDRHVICALPIRRAGAVGVLLLEFPRERQLTSGEVESLRLTTDLVSPRLIDLHEHDRWFGARWVATWRRGLAKALGPSHTWMKLAAVAIAAFLAWVCFADGTFHVSASFTLEPRRQAVVIAPFNGYIKSVLVRPGDKVIADKTILATLHTAKLRDQLAAAQAKLATYRKQADIAQSRGKFADVQIADDGVTSAEASIRLLSRRIRIAAIRSPISGVVLTGRLQRRIGEPVKIGQVLFKVAPLTPLLTRIRVSDSDILYVHPGQTGKLVTASYPGLKVPFKVVRIDPLAIVHHKHNVFDVRATLVKPPTWFRPGMQGTARINAGRRRYVWIWTRGLINWLRMKLWL